MLFEKSKWRLKFRSKAYVNKVIDLNLPNDIAYLNDCLFTLQCFYW